MEKSFKKLEKNEKKLENINLLSSKVIKELKGEGNHEVTQSDARELEKRLKEKLANEGPSLQTIRRFLGLDRSYNLEKLSGKILDKFSKYVGYQSFNAFQKWINNHSPLSPNHDLAKHYGAPLSRLGLSLAFRLKEIFEGRSAFLQDKQLKNEFNEYRYISTIYRLAAMLGWLTIIEKERFDFEPINEYLIRDIIFRFRDCLANGRTIEVQIVKDLCSLWKIETVLSQCDEAIINKAGIAIDNLRLAFPEAYIKENTSLSPTIKELEREVQKEFLHQVLHILQDTVLKNQAMHIDKALITQHHDAAINQIGRTQHWIFFDWQTGIGDLMREKVSETRPKFDVIGFGTFEDYFKDKNASRYRWIKRLIPLFKDFEYQVDQQKEDARIFQLTHLFYVLVDVIEAFNTRNDSEYIKNESALNKLKAFKKQLEVHFPVSKTVH